MTFYHEYILAVSKKMESKGYLYRQVIHAKYFIDQNYHRSITLEEMAGEAYFSKYHFLRLFKAVYGQTPFQHLKMVRIRAAKKLLRNGNSVAATCMEIGFESVSSFTGLFKKITGTTPAAYLKQKNNSAFPAICKAPFTR